MDVQVTRAFHVMTATFQADRRPHDKDRAARVVDAVIAHRALGEFLEAMQPSRADDQEGRTLALLG